MTLDDLIDFLCDECAEQTLSAMAIRRAVLLAYELGLEQGRKEAHGSATERS